MRNSLPRKLRINFFTKWIRLSDFICKETDSLSSSCWFVNWYSDRLKASLICWLVLWILTDFFICWQVLHWPQGDVGLVRAVSGWWGGMSGQLVCRNRVMSPKQTSYSHFRTCLNALHISKTKSIDA